MQIIPEDDTLRRWLAIGVGLMVGIFAKYAIRLQENKRIGWRHIAAEGLLLGFNAILCVVVIGRLGLEGPEAIALAALFGASSDRVFRAARRAFEKQLDQAAATVFADEDVTLPPTERPVTLRLSHARNQRDAIGEAIRTATPLAEPAEDMSELLRRLDEEPDDDDNESPGDGT